MKKYILFLLLFSFMFAQAENEKEALLKSLFDVYGGEKRLSEIKGAIQKGAAYVRLENVEGNITRTYVYPSKLRVEKSFAQIDSKIRVTNGEKAWLNDSQLLGSFEELMFLKAKTLFLAKYMSENRDEIEYRGEVTSEDNRNWHIFNIKFPSQSEILVQVDPNTYHIVSAITTVHQFPDKKTFLTLYGNYKMFDGVLIAQTEHEYMNGYYIGRTNIEKTEFTDGADSSLFIIETKPQQEKKKLPMF